MYTDIMFPYCSGYAGDLLPTYKKEEVVEITYDRYLLSFWYGEAIRNTVLIIT
jgi:hypothetical protein